MIRDATIEPTSLTAQHPATRLEVQLSKPALRYAIAAGALALAFGIRFWFRPELGDELPFMFFIAASLVAAWVGGAALGIAALVVGLILGDQFFLHSSLSHSSSRSVEAARVIRYILTAAIGVALIEVMHRGKRRTEALVTMLRSEVTRRKHSEEQLLEAKTQLAFHAHELELRVADRTAHLQATVASLESVLYEMAHNLRAPLRAMEGYATVLNQDHAANLSSAGKELCHRISDAGSRMDLLIKDLLKYGRLGHIEVTLETVELHEHIDSVLDQFSDQIKSNRAEINLRVPTLEIWAEPQLLQQVLHNLLDNALKFVTPGLQSRISIYSEARGPLVKLWIEDNGIGIDPKFDRRIFGPFECLNRNNLGTGTGMGLAVVAKAMERMGGSAGVESKPGIGSRFWLEFQRPPQSSNAPAEEVRAIMLKA